MSQELWTPRLPCVEGNIPYFYPRKNICVIIWGVLCIATLLHCTCNWDSNLTWNDKWLTYMMSLATGRMLPLVGKELQCLSLQILRANLHVYTVYVYIYIELAINMYIHFYNTSLCIYIYIRIFSFIYQYNLHSSNRMQSYVFFADSFWGNQVRTSCLLSFFLQHVSNALILLWLHSQNIHIQLHLCFMWLNLSDPSFSDQHIYTYNKIDVSHIHFIYI